MTGKDRAENAGQNRLALALRAIAVQAALLSAAAHLLWAWPLLGTGDPRPYVFITAAVFLAMIGAAVIHASHEYRRLYALGAGTLGALLVGYAGWYGAEAIETLASDPLILVAKVAEAVGLVAFAGLYRLAPPSSVVVERRREARERAAAAGEVEERPAVEGGTGYRSDADLAAENREAGEKGPDPNEREE